MVDSKIVKVIGDQDVPVKQALDGTLYTFDPAVCPASGTATANGLPGGTTVVDGSRTEVNDFWNTMALLITSGAWNGQIREITDWDLGTHTFTVAPAFGGQILTGVTYKVLAKLPGTADVAAIEAKLDARLDVAVSTRAAPGAAMALTPAERLIVQALILSDASPFAGLNVGLIKTQTDKIPRVLCSMDFWGDMIEELQLTSALQANLALGGNVVIAGIPNGVTLVRVVVMFMCRAIENTNQAANKLNGAQNIEVGFAGANFIDAIALADDLFAVALSTREMGTVIVGGIDVKATVTGNGTCTFRIDAAKADLANLNFNDFQIGVRVYFTI